MAKNKSESKTLRNTDDGSDDGLSPASEKMGKAMEKKAAVRDKSGAVLTSDEQRAAKVAQMFKKK